MLDLQNEIGAEKRTKKSPLVKAGLNYLLGGE
jgi:hypothetical protein